MYRLARRFSAALNTGRPKGRPMTSGSIPKEHSRWLAAVCVLLCIAWTGGVHAQVSRPQPVTTGPAATRSISVPNILTPEEASTVDLPIQLEFELPGGAAATEYEAEIAYWHPQQNKWAYVGLLGRPFPNQSLTIDAQRLLHYSPSATKWQIRVRMSTPPGPWSAWRNFTLGNPPSEGSSTSGTSPVASQPAQGVTPITAKLGVALASASSKNWEIGGTETTLYSDSPTLHLAWASAYQDQYQWQWQISNQPFQTDKAPGPGAILDSKPAPKGDFYIDLGKYLGGTGSQPASAPTRAAIPAPNSQGSGAARPASSGRASGIHSPLATASDFYVRLLPMAGNSAAPPSNSVIAHLKPGADPGGNAAAQAIAREQDSQADEAAWAEANRIYALKIASWSPAVFADPNLWGCVKVIRNPYVGQMSPPNPLFQFYEGQVYCPEKDPQFQEKSWDEWVVLGLGSYFLIYDRMVKIYNGAKEYIAEKIADWMPCEALGEDLEKTCHDATAYLVESALTAAMVYAGVPPSLPTLDSIKAAGKGKIVAAAVDAACETIEANQGTCTPEIREGLKLSFEQGIDSLEHELAQQASQPECGDVQAAKEHGRLPLPCFNYYPGTEVQPVAGSVYQPPVVSVRITKTRPSPYESKAHAATVTTHKPISCDISASLLLSNAVNKKTISGHYYEHADLNGRPFADPSAHIPRLKVGQSIEVPLDFATMQAVDFPGSIENEFNLMEWIHLYIGGKGPLQVTSACATNTDNIQVQIPK
jgi:hypothetical protein